jgi:hypothetical protein
VGTGFARFPAAASLLFFAAGLFLANLNPLPLYSEEFLFKLGFPPHAKKLLNVRNKFIRLLDGEVERKA